MSSLSLPNLNIDFDKKQSPAIKGEMNSSSMSQTICKSSQQNEETLND